MKRWFERGWFASLVVILVITVYGLYFYSMYQSISPSDSGRLTGVQSGTFGDAFGTLNALFSALACGGVIATLLLQRGDLRESKSQALDQQFEAIFYARLTLQQNVVDKLDLMSGGVVTASGRDCLRRFWRDLVRRYKMSSREKSHEERAQLAYSKLWALRHSDLGIYFRSLYSLLKFLDESGYRRKDKLGTVVRSLLSDHELVLILYNCLDRRGENFKRYAELFQLFDNLDVELLLKPSDVLRLPKKCFGKNSEALKIFELAGK